MKTTFFEISNETVFPQFFEDPLNGFYIPLAFIFDVNQNVI